MPQQGQPETEQHVRTWCRGARENGLWRSHVRDKGKRVCTCGFRGSGRVSRALTLMDGPVIASNPRAKTLQDVNGVQSPSLFTSPPPPPPPKPRTPAVWRKSVFGAAVDAPRTCY